MTEITEYVPSNALSAFFTSRTSRATARTFALEKFVLDWAETGAVSVFKGPGPDPTVLSGYDSSSLWLKTNTGVNATQGSVKIWNGTPPASSDANWVALTKSLFLDWLGATVSGLSFAVYDTRSSAASASVDSAKTFLVVYGYASTSDGGGGMYRKLGSTPSPVEAWQFQSADGAYWELVPEDGCVNVKALGATGDGSTDDTAAIQAALDYWAPFTTPAASGGVAYLPPGVYVVTSAIDMSACHGIKVLGAGPLATEVKTGGNHSIFYASGSSSAPLNKASIESMTIRGGGLAGTSMFGIDWTWNNGCQIKDIVGYGCRRVVSLQHQWQTVIEDLDVHGAGSDQSYDGLWMGETTTSFVDNAVIAVGVTIKDCSNDGFRIANGQGSKFTNCEAGGCNVGWNVGNVSAGPPPCQWVKFIGCLGDSCASYNWLFQAGAASYVGHIVWTGCWSGNAGLHGVGISGGKCMTLVGSEHAGNTQAAIYMTNCTECVVSGSMFSGNNEAEAASVYDITISGGSYITITGNHMNSDVATENVGEINASNNNVIIANTLIDGAVIIGADTKVTSNVGFITSVNGSDTIASGTSSKVVTHGMDVTPSLNDIILQPRQNLGAAGITDLWVSAVSSTTFTISADTNASSDVLVSYFVRSDL